MNRQTDPQSPTALESHASPSPSGAAPVDSHVQGAAVLAALEREQVDVAATLLREMLSADQGILLRRASRAERRLLIALLTPDEIADILDEAPTPAAAAVTRELPPDQAADILDDVDTHTVADILQELPDAHAAAIVAELDHPEEVVPLLQFRADTAGGMMTPDFPRVRNDVTAGNALDALRLFGEDAEGFGWVCVVDRGQRLTGYVSIAQLALSSPTRTVQDLADQYDHRLVSVPPEMDQEEVHRIMSRYSFSIVPVVDAEERVLGVIRAEEAMRVAEDEATEDMLRIASAPGERVFGPLHLSVRHRLPWLVLNLGTVLLAAAVVNLFESTIAAIAMLAVFLPVVAGQGGIAGTQTVTLVVRGMAIGEVPPPAGLRLLGREILLGLMHGMALAALAGALGWVWKGSPGLGVALAAAMVGNLLVAALTGAGVPLLLRRLGIDPAVSSAVFVTTFTDVLGFLIFLAAGAFFVTRLG